MASEHPCFQLPSDKKIKIWRYMDVVGLLSLLQTQSLYFPRAHKLGDPFEGSLPLGNIKAREYIISHRETDPNLNFFKNMSDDQINGFFHQQSISNQDLVKTYFINCWHMNEHESMAMWKLYSVSPYSVCIQTTLQKLSDILPSYVNIGMINYITYDESSYIPLDNAFWSILHKRKSFEHEREIRAVAWEWLCAEQGGNIVRGNMSDEGLYVPINPSELISSIYINPSSPNWVDKVIIDAIKDSKLDVNITKSDLARSPLF